MQKDLRDRNRYFSTRNIYEYLEGYSAAMHKALKDVDFAELDKALFFLETARAYGGRIFAGGNGGSAAISDHLCCDFQKGTHITGKPSLLLHSLVGSQALFTAIGNDLGYDRTLSFQLAAAGVNNKDLVILISSSGNSPNIVKAAEVAHVAGAKVLGLTGFDGGKLRNMADCSLHVAVDNYGVIEDCHQALMHILAQFHFLKIK